MTRRRRRPVRSRALRRELTQPPGLPGRDDGWGGARPGRLQHGHQTDVLRRELGDDPLRRDRLQLADAGRHQPVPSVRERAPGHPPQLHLAAGERGPRQDHHGRVHPGRRVRRGDDQQLRDADVVGQRLAGEPPALHRRAPPATTPTTSCPSCGRRSPTRATCTRCPSTASRPSSCTARTSWPRRVSRCRSGPPGTRWRRSRPRCITRRRGWSASACGAIRGGARTSRRSNTVINSFGGRWYDPAWKAQLTSPEVERAVSMYVSLVRSVRRARGPVGRLLRMRHALRHRAARPCGTTPPPRSASSRTRRAARWPAATAMPGPRRRTGGRPAGSTPGRWRSPPPAPTSRRPGTSSPG